MNARQKQMVDEVTAVLDREKLLKPLTVSDLRKVLRGLPGNMAVWTDDCDAQPITAEVVDGVLQIGCVYKGEDAWEELADQTD